MKDVAGRKWGSGFWAMPVVSGLADAGVHSMKSNTSLAPNLGGSTDALISNFEDATSPEIAIHKLYDLLMHIRARPVQHQQRRRVLEAITKLDKTGVLEASHPWMKALEARLSPSFLPGIHEADLTLPDTSPPRPRSGTFKAVVRDESFSEEGGSSTSPSRRQSFTQSLPANPTHGQSSTLDEAELASELALALSEPSGDDPESFLFQPVPQGAKFMCTLTRSSSAIRVQYRLYLEQVMAQDEDACHRIRQDLEARHFPPELRIVVPADEWESASTPTPPTSTTDARRLLFEGRRTKASKTFTLSLYSCHNGKRRALVGRMVCPSVGVFAASPCASQNGHASDKPVLGSRLCTEVKEGGDKVLSVTAVLPTEQGTGNVHADKAEILEPTVAHLHALCSPSVPPAIFALRNRPPRWSAWQNLHTLEFEGAGRVLEPSRKNISILDVRSVVDERDVYMGVISASGPGRQGSLAHEEWPFERQNRATLQLGKIGEDRFSLDFRWPLSPFQALCMALSVHEK